MSTYSNIFVCECHEYSTYQRHVQAPLFRKSIIINEPVISAEISICGLGFYDLFINGERITKSYLAPYISNSDQLIYYDTYDLKNKLLIGENVIGIMLGDGMQNGKIDFWDFKDSIVNSSPKLALSLEIKTDKNDFSINASDFMCKKGPITFNDLRSGIFYDKRLEDKGWNIPGFSEDNSWHKPEIADRPRGEAKFSCADPIVIAKELKPVSIKKGELYPYETISEIKSGLEAPPTMSGGYIYDFGENNAGIFRLKIKGKKGQRIDIQCAERLCEGKVDHSNINSMPLGYSQRDIYIVGSDEEEIFEPMFTYHGFRYLYISGITEEQATEDLLTYLVMSSDLKPRGSFRCSDDTVNKIYAAMQRSDLSNFYYFPTDCPHREKNGWTGDAALSAEHTLLTLEAEESYREWLANIRKTQLETGMLPCIIPTISWGYEWGNGPAWDRVIFEIPYLVYKYRGRTDIIEENAHMMLSYLEYISKRRDERGIVEVGLGDWLPVDCYHSHPTPLGLSCNILLYDACKKAEIMFSAIGLSHNALFAHNLGLEFREAARKTYINFDTMLLESECQTAQAMAIFYDLFNEDEKEKAFSALLDIIRKDNDKLTCGCLGIRIIFHTLAEGGYAELAYKMITGEEYPSYAYWINMGKTTLFEQFLPFGEHYIRSENHHYFGDVGHWFMRHIGGINVIDHKTVRIKPIFIENLSFAETEHILPSGKVKTYWCRKNDQIELTVSVPKDISCTVDVDETVKITYKRSI